MTKRGIQSSIYRDGLKYFSYVACLAPTPRDELHNLGKVLKPISVVILNIKNAILIVFLFFRSLSKKRQSKEDGRLATRKSPHYHNTLLEAPDGQPLCVCATGKAEWYISKGLGVKVYSLTPVDSISCYI